MTRLVTTLLLLALAATPAVAQSGFAYVTRVAEGDLIYAELGGRIETIRYLGINVPVIEHPARGREPYASVVRERNRQLVDGRWIQLAFEREPRDEHGRLKAYVWVGDVFVNAALLHYGYAEAAPPAADMRYAAYFKDLENDARSARRGLWRYDDVIAYYKPGGLEQTGDLDYLGRPTIGVGGRVFSAPAPFIPAPAPGGPAVSSPAPSVGSPATPPPTSSRNAPGSRPGLGTRY